MEGLNYVGAGLACLAMLGAAIGAAYLDGAMRNPSAAPAQFGNLIFGFAVTEALGIFGFAVALILIFAV
jgi:F-type H+-transporting ATPase subunit c